MFTLWRQSEGEKNGCDFNLNSDPDLYQDKKWDPDPH